MARPSKFSEEVLQEICHRMSQGEPLAVICRDDHMPGVTTVHDWKGHEEYGQRVSESIAHAREAGHDMIAWQTRLTARLQGESTNDVQRDKLIIETDLKLLSKWNSGRYGEKVDHTLAGPDGGPVRTSYTWLPPQLPPGRE